MHKWLLSILGLFIIIGFAGVDYLVHFRPSDDLNPAATVPDVMDVVTEPSDSARGQDLFVSGQPNGIIERLIQGFPQKYSYKILSIEPSLELFGTFDLSPLTDLEIHRIKLGSNVSEVNQHFPFTVYQIISKSNQIGLAYVNLERALLSQVGSPDQLNTVNEYGDAAFFYNSPANPETAFLLARINDVILGFQYQKQDDRLFASIRAMINDVQLLQ